MSSGPKEAAVAPLQLERPYLLCFKKKLETRIFFIGTLLNFKHWQQQQQKN